MLHAPRRALWWRSRPSHRQQRGGNALEYDWAPQLLLSALHLTPELRSACAPVVGRPPSLVLDSTDEVMDALGPIATCLTLGPLACERLHVVGSSELPGRWQGPGQGAGRADQLRSTLSLVGVPFENVVTHDVDSGRDVELGVGPS